MWCGQRRLRVNGIISYIIIGKEMVNLSLDSLPFFVYNNTKER